MARTATSARVVVASVAAATIAMAALAACGRLSADASPPSRGSTAARSGDAVVTKVVDGDTVRVRFPGRERDERVRLIGVDTPETKDPRRPVQCYGREAAAFLASVLPEGQGVRLVGDVEQQDVYDRTLAYVYRLPDGMFVNAELLRRGFAQVLTIPPNVAHADAFVALAAEARNGSRGLWSACPEP